MAELRPNLRLLAGFKSMFHRLNKKAQGKGELRMEARIFVWFLLDFYHIFEIVFHYVAHSGLELALLPEAILKLSILLPQPPVYCNYKHGSLPKSSRYVEC